MFCLNYCFFKFTKTRRLWSFYDRAGKSGWVILLEVVPLYPMQRFILYPSMVFVLLTLKYVLPNIRTTIQYLGFHFSLLFLFGVSLRFELSVTNFVFLGSVKIVSLNSAAIHLQTFSDPILVFENFNFTLLSSAALLTVLVSLFL